MKTFMMFCVLVAASTAAVAQIAAKTKPARAEVRHTVSRVADRSALEERMGQRQLDMLIAHIIDEDVPARRGNARNAAVTALASR